jgi:hypothetical protein
MSCVVLCSPLCSARRGKLTKYLAVVDNYFTFYLFIFIFPYSSIAAARISLGYFISKATPKGAKQGEIGKQETFERHARDSALSKASQ